MNSEDVKRLKSDWLRRTAKDGDDYLDEQGFFMEDFGHHRGGTKRIRKATAEEVLIYNAFDLIIKTMVIQEIKEERISAYFKAKGAGLNVEVPEELKISKS